ncbi:hypothetical protein [Coralliovum pocilloporae]|uniref:hypothetical protein n=1 Tax=Coralliovum pocilloporae TaxID=3066369 RepID=UPI003307789D
MPRSIILILLLGALSACRTASSLEELQDFDLASNQVYFALASARNIRASTDIFCPVSADGQFKTCDAAEAPYVFSTFKTPLVGWSVVPGTRDSVFVEDGITKYDIRSTTFSSSGKFALAYTKVGDQIHAAKTQTTTIDIQSGGTVFVLHPNADDDFAISSARSAFEKTFGKEQAANLNFVTAKIEPVECTTGFNVFKLNNECTVNP